MQVKTQRDELQDYLTDASNMPGGHAEKLYLPETEDEVAAILRDASAAGVRVTVSGARTGTVGGAIPFGGIVISLEKLKSLEIDRVTRSARVGAGVILRDLQQAADSAGLFYPPDPTEWSCQIGGTVATNASGARSFKYGATRDYVDRIRVVLANGEIREIVRGRRSEAGDLTPASRLTYQRPNVRKNVSGYFNDEPLDPIDIFIGSEGTLGVITEVQLRLLEKPAGLFSGVVFFQNEADLLRFVEEVKVRSFAAASKGDVNIQASLVEYFDDKALKFIAERFPETPLGAAGAIYFEQETTAANEDNLFSTWNDLLEACGADVEGSWFTTSEQDREKMRAFRHALPVAVNERITRYGQRKVGTDMAVPDENFPSFLRFYRDTLASSGLDYVIFGHIGDCHLHANMLPRDAAEAEKARYVYGRCVAQAIMLGGTVSAEHGIGKLKRKYLAAMMGERYLNEMAELKRSLDPNGVLSPGNIFDEEYLR